MLFDKREELYQDLLKAIKESIVELKPENKYILILPANDDNEVDSITKTLRDILEINEKSNLRFAILVGENIKLLEIT